ncbi:MAG: Holliday junction branch migration protein RuvA [Clostridia bacterium]|jgi:Holliday junction DNA helicase RuvA|nr:Holliday junction branch migration protein RuvA [Clostridia bacterium]
MIGYINGKILSLSPETALIETASGIGFEVQCTGAAFSALSGKKEGAVYAYMHVKEDGVALYGFASTEEKEMFLKLISVSGVGPKMGITILSGMRASDVAAAIATNDVKRLSSVKGMGKKTAERIILELREKVSVTIKTEAAGESVPVTVGSGDEDAVVALMTLGFTRSESVKAIARAREQGAASVEDIIMLALRGM